MYGNLEKLPPVRHSSGSQQPNGWSSWNPVTMIFKGVETLDPCFRRDDELEIRLFEVAMWHAVRASAAAVDHWRAAAAGRSSAMPLSTFSACASA